MEAIRYYASENNRRLTFEYILLKGVNDKPEHVKTIGKIIKRIKCLCESNSV